MLTQLLTEEVISIEAGAHDWRHAIELATAPLLANGTIAPSYVAALYRSHEELGPYYVLGPGLAMPHARPEDGVNRLGLALDLPRENVAPRGDLSLPPDLEARLRRACAADFEVWARAR